jgi:hypothetical protein
MNANRSVQKIRISVVLFGLMNRSPTTPFANITEPFG